MMIATNQRRGAEVFGVTLAEHLSERGFDVSLLALNPSPTEPRLDLEPAGRSRLDPRMWWAAYRAARGADVVFGIGSSSLLVGSIAAKLARRPFVYRSIGDPAYWGQARGAGLRIGVPLRSAAFVGALFPAAKRYMTGRYGCAEDRVGVIPSAVDVRLFGPLGADAGQQVRSEIGVETRHVVAFVGALSPEKSPDLAIDVMAHLPDDYSLVIAGDGPMREQLEGSAAQHGGRVTFLGVRTDIARVLAATDVVLMPSRTEGVPRAAIEAGLCEVPVVGTDVGGLGWVVEDGVTGHVLSSFDAAELAAAVIDAVDKRPSFGPAARKRCSEIFGFDAVADSWAAALRSVVA